MSTSTLTDEVEDAFHQDNSATGTIRKGTIDVGLDGLPYAVSLDVSPAYINQGLKIIADILAMPEADDISDIQLRTDRYIYIATSSGLKRFEGPGRLDTPDVIGVLLALIYNRDAGIAVSDDLQQREREALERAMTARRKVDFSCEGGVAALVSQAGGHALSSGRFRVQAHFSATGLGVTCRILRESIMSLEETGLPPDIINSLTGFVKKKSGLGIVTGATGSGKTTTLAALVEWVRRNLNRHVVTIEDPIEYHYRDTVNLPRGGETPSNTLITQQEVGRDVLTFQQGLEDALRKKPDIILLGEIRDAATMETCMEAAQTGHLVLTTLHTRGAVKTLSRLAEFFPASQQDNTMSRLAECLLFILSQGLLPPATGAKRILGLEYLQNIDDASSNAIRKYGTAANALEDQMAKSGNIQWDKNLHMLYHERKITEETFREYALDRTVSIKGR